MDAQIFAAIVGGVFVIAAAIITITPTICKRKPTQKDKLSAGFQFGYYAMELYYTIKFKYEYARIIEDENYKEISEKLIAESKAKCLNLALLLAIDFKAETIQYNYDVDDHPAYISEIETATIILPINVRYCINSARRLSAVFHRDYQFNFFGLMGRHFPKDVIDHVKQELDDEITKSRMEFKKTNLNTKIIKGIIDYINSLRNAPDISKADWALSFMKMRRLIEDAALRINQ
jgi:hypothetical protein